jgi:hypothetical protein
MKYNTQHNETQNNESAQCHSILCVVILSVANKHFKLGVVILNVEAPTLKTQI